MAEHAATAPLDVSPADVSARHARGEVELVAHERGGGPKARGPRP